MRLCAKRQITNQVNILRFLHSYIKGFPPFQLAVAMTAQAFPKYAYAFVYISIIKNE